MEINEDKPNFHMDGETWDDAKFYINGEEVKGIKPLTYTWKTKLREIIFTRWVRFWHINN